MENIHIEIQDPLGQTTEDEKETEGTWNGKVLRGFHSGAEITAMVSSSEFFFSEESPAAARSRLSGFTKVKRDGTETKVLGKKAR